MGKRPVWTLYFWYNLKLCFLICRCHWYYNVFRGTTELATGKCSCIALDVEVDPVSHKHGVSRLFSHTECINTPLMQSYIQYLSINTMHLPHFHMAIQVLYLVFKKLASCGESSKIQWKKISGLLPPVRESRFFSAIYTRLACVTRPQWNYSQSSLSRSQFLPVKRSKEQQIHITHSLTHTHTKLLSSSHDLLSTYNFLG